MTLRSLACVLVGLCAGLAACGAPREAPQGPGPVPTKTADLPVSKAPSNLIDSGTLVTFFAEQPVSRESFAIRRAGSHFVLESKTVAAQAGDTNGSEGELEVDEQFRPVRAAFRKLTAADGLTYKLGGSPLTLDVTRDDGRDPQHLVAPGAIDVFINGPGMSALTALCRVNGDVAWSTFGDGETATIETIEAYVAQSIGAAKRVVMDVADEDFEVLCDGNKLIAGGMARFQIWFSREGNEVHLDALKAAPRPSKHAWKHPQDPAEPWSTYHTWLFDTGVLVTRDGRRRTMRLTTFDAKTGAVIKHRDFAVPAGRHLMCEPLPKGRLICEIGKLDFLRVLDARTLEDQQDLAPLLHRTVKDSEGAQLSFDAVKGEQIDIVVDGEKNVRIDVAKGTAAVVEMPKQRNYLGTLDAALCSSTGKDGPFKGSRLLACKSKRAATYALSYDGDKSALALVGRGNKSVWQTVLGAHPADVRTSGDLLLVTTASEARRVIAIDSKTGVIKWVAAGPQPTKP